MSDLRNKVRETLEGLLSRMENYHDRLIQTKLALEAALQDINTVESELFLEESRIRHALVLAGIISLREPPEEQPE